MKLQSFFLLTVIFTCVCTIFVPGIEGDKTQATVTFKKGAILGTRCRVWIEDDNGYRIAGDGAGDYHECGDDNDQLITFNFEKEYWVHVKVQGSAKKTKIRGPHTTGTCLEIEFGTADWDLDYC